jgi:hypothetical protein
VKSQRRRGLQRGSCLPLTSALEGDEECLSFQDYMQNVHGKEIDLLRVTVKVPGKRPPRAVAPAGPCAGPALAPAAGVNGVPKGGPSSSTEGPASSLSGEQNLDELISVSPCLQ